MVIELKSNSIPSTGYMPAPYVCADADTLASERREVTVAFADLRGFTTLADCLPSEELVSVLNIYLSIVAKTFRKYDGLIDKFMGDGVMGIWNAPAPCPEHARQATMAAFEAQQVIHTLQKNEPTLPRIDFGIGINTGWVISGNIGCEEHREYSVIGDAVNVAAKITAAVPGGRVWITLDTMEQAKDCVVVMPLDPLALKGKRQAVKAYEVIDIALPQGRRL
ncbi:MAG: adenylate/guanylate cyclase domain-containing protein [Dehalococcoidales bacterium]|nr:adenylate/guanylate cyclase domain-containing protein [Dehalococcoidales bacterium]